MSPGGDGLGGGRGVLRDHEARLGGQRQKNRGPTPSLRTASLPGFERLRHGWKDVADFSLLCPTWE